MKNEIKIFKNVEFGNVRTVVVNDEPYFVGKDVAEILGYKNINDALIRHIDEEDKSDIVLHDGRQNRNMKIINESGLHSLILSSKLPSAKKFKRWVTSEVLPSIRKYGGYLTPQKIEEVLLNPDTIIQLATSLKEEQEKNKKLQLINRKQETLIDELTEENIFLTEENEEMKPKSLYCDLVLQSDGLMTITQIAKDYGYSAVKFNELLHNLGIQYKQGSIWLLYAKYQDKGYTHSKTYVNEDINKSFSSTQWTQEGRLFLYNFLKECGIVPVMEKENN